MEIVFIPVSLTTGNMALSLPMAFCSRPKAFGMDGPVISASSMAVLYPILWVATASMDVTEDFPTPPLPDITPITFFTFDSLFI